LLFRRQQRVRVPEFLRFRGRKILAIPAYQMRPRPAVDLAILQLLGQGSAARASHSFVAAGRRFFSFRFTSFLFSWLGKAAARFAASALRGSAMHTLPSLYPHGFMRKKSEEVKRFNAKLEAVTRAANARNGQV
jgi:hypothetical protein